MGRPTRQRLLGWAAPAAIASTLGIAALGGPACNQTGGPAPVPRAGMFRDIGGVPLAKGAGPASGGRPPAPASSDSATSSVPSPAVARSAVATVKVDSAWAMCHRAIPAANKDTAAGLAWMAVNCEKQTRMTKVSDTLTGKQADQDPPQSFAFEAKASHCYRAYARAADGIKELDLAIKDSFGAVAAEDASENLSSIVPEGGAVCFSKDDRASVVVSIGMGSGSYALQIWGD
jgi:hypothetical protein